MTLTYASNAHLPALFWAQFAKDQNLEEKSCGAAKLAAYKTWTRPKKIPDYQTNYRQNENDADPQDGAHRVGIAATDLQYRVNISDEDDQS